MGLKGIHHMHLYHPISLKRTAAQSDLLKKLQMPFLFALLMGFVLLLIYCLLGEEYVFGSYVDWNSQHGVLPDYFRQKFYETGSLTGDLALELGGGVNPYALAYHGMLNPVLLPSYLFPSLHMYHYIMISSIVLLFASIVLLYLWLRGQRFSRPIAYFASVMLALSSPFLFHFHKQVMFVNYMPFLLLSLMGVDRLLLHRKKALFILSFALSLLTSFFFAITLIIAVSIYFFYRYLQLHKGLRGHPLRHIGSFALSGLASCLMTCAVILPAFVAILGGRETNAHTVVPTLIECFLPRVSFSKLLYSNYGAGLSVILLFALFALFFYKKPHTTFLSLSLIALWLFPISSYVMNAFLYDRGKAYIALLPLFILAICLFIRDGAHLQIPLRAWLACAAVLIIAAALFDRVYLYPIIFESLVFLIFLLISKLYRTPLPLCLSSVAVLLVVCIAGNSGEYGQYLTKVRYNDFVNPAKEKLLSTYAESDTPTRMADLTGAWYTCNQTYGENLLRSSIYASSSNQAYIDLLHESLRLTNPTPHKIALPDVNNIFFATLMGQEWLIGWDSTRMEGYESVGSEDKWTLYRNPDAYTLGFAADRLMSKREFDALTPADKQFALTGYAVVEDDRLPDVYSSPFTKLDIEGQIPLEATSNGWLIRSENDVKFSITPDSGEHKIYALRVKFDEMQDYHIYVTVNGIKNTFSGYEGAFPNDNSDLWYIISDQKESLDLNFSAGDYTVSAIELYAMDRDELDANRGHMTMTDELQYDRKNTLVANIHTDRQGKFLFTIPTADGFTLHVDGVETPIEVIDEAFIGCSLSEGEHEISLTYKPPFRTIGIILALVGCALTTGLIVWDERRKIFGKRKIRKPETTDI